MKVVILVALAVLCVVASNAAPASETINWLEVELNVNAILEIAAFACQQAGVIARYDDPTVGASINQQVDEVFGRIFPVVNQTYRGIEEKNLTVEQAEKLIAVLLEDVLSQDLESHLMELSTTAAGQIRYTLAYAHAQVTKQGPELTRLLEQ